MRFIFFFENACKVKKSKSENLVKWEPIRGGVGRSTHLSVQPVVAPFLIGRFRKL